MALISMVVISIVPWRRYRFSDDRVLELVDITAAFENDSEGSASGMVWAQIVEPQQMAKGQPPGGYPRDNRRVRMTVAKSVGLGLGDRIKFSIAS
jgi:hypothetical protein